jgi:hypothetical protein
LLLGTAARAEAGPPQLWMAWNSCQPLYAWDLFLGNAPTRIPTAVVGGGERR